MLTTVDNPYNPVKNWDDWYAFDIQKGYNTCAYLARITESAEAFPENLENEAIKKGIKDILRINPLGIYREVDDETGDLIIEESS